ncbi:MAG: 4-(cytidine 5'-diphospho)-2-C-methyl-D-erythritol kinase [Candidatus Omnitrophica bacterium]|nr:4-(cytidine 5'-diphospho)-2-C-methyl-D-erythritol kinase [Candidatus Omnitrophota bacterium]
MNAVSLQAFAKVNLFLDVLGKRSDGTHELVTLFERVGLADDLTVEKTASPGLRLESASREIPLDRTNLAARAAEAFRRRSGWTEGVTIRLEKRIPVGGGLGGGSSNAAATLIALQQLSGQVLPTGELMACARELGSDVAFFAAQLSWGIGRERGDVIEPKDFQFKLWHLLVTPDFPISTPSVYAGFTPSDRHPDPDSFLRVLAEGQPSRIRPILYNALEPTVEKLYPQIRRVKSEMEAAGLEKPMVSGSGSTVFALCGSEAQARWARDALKAKHPTWKMNVVCTV